MVMLPFVYRSMKTNDAFDLLFSPLNHEKRAVGGW